MPHAACTTPRPDAMDSLPANDALPAAAAPVPRWPLMAVSGGTVAFVVSALAPAAARQTVAVAGRTGADSASADLADAAASAFAVASAAAVLVGAVALAARMRAWTHARWRARRRSIHAGAWTWMLASAASAAIGLLGAPSWLRVTPDGAQLALAALEVLGAALLAHGVRAFAHATGRASLMQREAGSVCASLETAVVAAAATVACRLFPLTLPALGWSALVMPIRAVGAAAALVLVLSVTWAFVGCWQLGARAARPARDAAPDAPDAS